MQAAPKNMLYVDCVSACGTHQPQSVWLLSLSIRQLTLVLLGDFDEFVPQHFIVGMLKNTLQVFAATVHDDTAGSTRHPC